ncbi:MAG: uracil-DNA glycosylase [Bacillota bacterium]|jgi:uracil-DNA glycosylase family 4
MDDEKQLQLFDGFARDAIVSEREAPVSWHLDNEPVPEPAPRRTFWSETDRRDDLADLAAVAEAACDCRRCKLGGMRKNAVPGEGNPNARIMWIGEGPGADEDEQGRPFVGAAGRLLDRLIAAMGLSREEVFIGNVVKCRPPHNRAPEPDEVRACLPYLARQIELIRPEIIVILGGTALKALIDPRSYITRMRGKWIERGGIMIMPTFHPAALLRDPAKKHDVWADMQQVLARMK